MFAPAIGQVMKEMDTTNRDLGSFAVSIYLLGYAFGPLFIGPCSELYGRLVIYHTCSVLFLLTNIGCALATNMPMLITFRVLTGVMGASPLTVGPGTVADLFQREERGRAMAIWTMPILIGPCIGPAVGAYLGRAEGWRWDFWLLIIMVSELQVETRTVANSRQAGTFFVGSVITLRETHPPTLLRWKAKKLRKAGTIIQPSSELDEPPLHLIVTSVIRPIKMLFMSPIIFGLSLLTAVNYGVLYLLFTSVTEVFETRYGIVNNVGLVYFGIGAGQITGIAVFGFVSDAIVRKLAKGGEMKPEHRLPPMIPGALMVPMGLLIYGWTAQYRVHWFVPIIGNFFIGVGVITVFAPVSTYIVDAFTAYAASATAANTVFRSMGGALLPLAGPRMYAALGQGWGNTLLAGVSILMMSMIWVVMKYGEQLRTHPKYQLKL
jgi:multidrug resistance protein